MEIRYFYFSFYFFTFLHCFTPNLLPEFQGCTHIGISNAWLTILFCQWVHSPRTMILLFERNSNRNYTKKNVFCLLLTNGHLRYIIDRFAFTPRNCRVCWLLFSLWNAQSKSYNTAINIAIVSIAHTQPAVTTRYRWLDVWNCECQHRAW